MLINYLKATSIMYATLLMTACGGGFEVLKPPSDQLMFIKNTEDISTLADSPDYKPHPLPTLPASMAPEMLNRPYTLKPMSLDNINEPKTITTTAAGDVTPADVNTPPFNSFAKLNFFEGGSSYTCSSEFVGDSNDVILTAAHCVYSNSTNTWNNGWRAYSKYKNGAYEQQFIWDCAAIFSGWAAGGYPYDYAFIKLSGKAPNSLGLRGATIPQQFKSVGYPSNYHSGQQLVQVDGTKGASGGGIVQMAKNPFGPGSSGGAWLDNSTAIGLNSFKYDNDSNSVWGPQFDENTIALYEFVRRGCHKEIEGNTSLSNLEESNKVKVEAAVDLPSPGPELKYLDSENCSCPNSSMVALKNSTTNRYMISLRKVVFGPTPEKAMVESIVTEALPGETRNLTCSIDKGPNQQCSIRNSFAIESSRNIRRMPDPVGIIGVQSISAANCSQLCADGAPSGYCLPLGSSAQPILKSLGSFIGDALNSPLTENVVITVDEMVKTFGGDPAKVGNPCERSSFFRNQDIVSNEGMDCKITTSPLDNSPQALRLSLGNPTQTKATRIQDPNDHSKFSLAIFSNRSTSPVLQFTGQSNQGDLNTLFGGTVIAIERTGKKLVVTTENGCIAGEPQ